MFFMGRANKNTFTHTNKLHFGAFTASKDFNISVNSKIREKCPPPVKTGTIFNTFLQGWSQTTTTKAFVVPRLRFAMELDITLQYLHLNDIFTL